MPIPKASERLIWVVVACLAWKFAITNEALGVGRLSVASVVLVVSGFALGLAALLVAISTRAARWLEGYRIFGIFTFLFVAYGTVDAIARMQSPYVFTTDAHGYMDYAARLLLGGKNPYDASLYGAMVTHRMPVELQTPLVDGGLSDRLAYPSLSVLYLVPFVKLGIDTAFAYAAALYGCLAILYWTAPKELRPLVLIPFFADNSYLSFCFGGVTDSVWALLLCLVVVTWKRPTARAILFGLACSYKQHPWLLAPFLLVRIARETDRSARLKELARFSAITAATFVVLNLPLFAMGPRAWLLGIVEPLVTPMVPLGEGLSAFLPLTGQAVPKVVFSLAFWGAMGALLLVCATWRPGSVLVWIAPSLAFFLNYRSLSTYWYFNALPFVVELARTDFDKLEPLALPAWPGRLAPKLGPLLGAAGLVVVLGASLFGQAKNAEVDVTLREPIRTWSSYAHRVDLRVTNHGKHPMVPRFWVQGVSFQPLPWRIDMGPLLLEPGQTADYSISAVHRISEFDVARGARLTMTDLRSSLRKSLTIPPDSAALSPRAVPNPALRFWDVGSGAPTYWVPSQEGSPGARVSPLLDGARRGVVLTLEPDPSKMDKELLHFCVAIPSCYAASESAGRFVPEDLVASDHRVTLAADFAARPEPIRLWVHPPKGANEAPAYADRYGAQLWFGTNPVMVLIGGERASGKLDDGTPYEIIAAPREAWSRVTLDLGELQARYAPLAYPKSHVQLRFRLIDVPFVPVRLALTYASRASATKSAMFGEIEDAISGRDPVPELLRELDRHPGQVDAWRASYEANLKNPSRAYDYIERARRLESHPELELQSAQLALTLGRLEPAKESFLRIVADKPVEAHLGLGWATLGLGKPEEARAHFVQALEAIQATTKGRLDGEGELQRMNGTVGLAVTSAVLGDCAGALKALEGMPERERELRLVDIPEIARCHGK
jgi:uncharacterized membrane protein